MRRWHQDLTVTHRQWSLHRRSHVEFSTERSQGFRPGQLVPGVDPDVVACRCDDQSGRFRKHHAHDCGHARCHLCHGHKFPRRELTRAEVRAGRVFDEQVRELLTASQ